MKKVMNNGYITDTLDSEIDRLQHIIMMKDRIISKKLHLAMHRQNICRVFKEITSQYKPEVEGIVGDNSDMEGGLDIDVDAHGEL